MGWGGEKKKPNCSINRCLFHPMGETHRPHLRKSTGGVGQRKSKKNEEHAGGTLVTQNQLFSFPEEQGFHHFALLLLQYRLSSQDEGDESVRSLLPSYALVRAYQSCSFPSGCLTLSVFLSQTDLRLFTTAAQRRKKKKKLYLILKLGKGTANIKYWQFTYYYYFS